MSNYTAKDITVLEGLEPVRKRPGMYIGGVGTAGLHHLAWEILDNAVDEAMNGFASNITVTLHRDGSSITISDDGRGIPVDKHPTTKKSAVEVTVATPTPIAASSVPEDTMIENPAMRPRRSEANRPTAPNAAVASPP